MDLGPSAKAAVHAGFRQGMTLAAIADKVRADTGETIPVSSLQRYRDYWHATERHVVEAHEKAQELLQAFKDRPTAELQKVLQDTVEAITLNQLVEAHSLDPIDLGHLGVKQQQVALKVRQLALEERKVAALEAKVRRMEDAAEKARKAVDRAAKKKVLGAEDLKTIREQVYGIS